MERFIEAVRQYPCLWDIASKEYRNIDIKEAAWKSIVEDLNSEEVKDVKAAKSEWKKLRDSHRDSLKRMKTTKSGQKATRINTWKYAEVMEFLLPYMKNRSTSTNLSCENVESPATPQEPDDESNHNEIADNSETSVNSRNNTIHNTEVSTQRGSRKRNADGEFIEILKEMEQNHLKRQEDRVKTNDKCQKEKHAIDLFLESMAITIKTMPSWMQSRIKKKNFLVVSDAEDELQNYNCVANSVNNNMPAEAGSSLSATYGYSTSAESSRSQYDILQTYRHSSAGTME